MYTELHLHSAYSLLDGASQPEELVLRAVELGYTALALTDHDNLSGAMEFAQAAKAAGIQPITGAEITLVDGSHLTLLAESRVGYGNLCRLITDLKHGGEPAGVALDDVPVPPQSTALAEYAEGLILLTGCRHSQLCRLVDAGRQADATRLLTTYRDWFGRDNVFVELQQNFVHGDTPRIAQLVRLAEVAGLPCVATGNVHYHRPERHRLQDVLVAITHRSTLDGTHRQRRPNAEFYLRSPEQMTDIFCRYPEAVAATELIARRCAAFDLTCDLHYTFPDFGDGTGESSDEVLIRTCLDTFGDRYPTSSPLIDRALAQMHEELAIIARHQLAGFFLVYRDLLTMAREVAQDIRGFGTAGSRRFLPPGRGRGSAVSSVVCYLIGLSPVDPLAHNLYVGRFLNDSMASVPDIDIDFPREIRDRMIERVSEVYGRDYTAMVCAFATYRLPSAVRDVGKALGIPTSDLDRITKLAEPRRATSLGEELARFPEYATRMGTPPWSYLVEIAHQLAGFPRHITQHSGGMIISSTPLKELVPIQPAAMDGRYICQWDKDSVNDAGLIKIDFLALGMLSQVEECLSLIDATRQREIDLSRIDYNDPAVFAMIQAGETIGTFQVESRAQIQMVRRTLPESLADLVVQVAIVRPGPIIGGAVTPFVQRRLDPDFTPTYDHPDLEDILEETLGVVLYQEQVIQVAERLAGFTPGQADQFRRAMSRKRSVEAMAAMKEEFITGATNRGVHQSTAETVFAKLEGFAGYGFPKSHAAAFGLLAYQTCWLKHYYPAQFLCALLNNQSMGFYAPHVLINDARHHGLRVLRPDVNQSELMCSVEGMRTIRVGLSLVKNVSLDTAEAIVDDRQARGAYRSLADLFRRVPMRPATLENLIGSGASDGFGLQRREMLWQIGLFIPGKRLSAGRKQAKTSGRQLSLAVPTVQDAVDLPPTTSWERVEESYRVLGVSLQHHPLGLIRHHLPSGLVSSADLGQLPHGMPVSVPGLVVCRQRPETAKGITFMLLEDEFGLINVIVYPNLYAEQRYEVRSVPFLLGKGKLQKADNNINIVAQHLTIIDRRYLEDGQERWHEHQDDRQEQADIQRLSFVAQAAEPPPADLLAVQPRAHNYR